MLAKPARGIVIGVAASAVIAGAGVTLPQTGVAASSSPISTLAQPSESWSEPTVFSRVTESAGGVVEREIYTVPVNFQTSDGEWHEIDNSLVSSDRSGFAAENAAGPVDVLIPQDAGSGAVRVEGADDSWLSLRAVGADGAPEIDDTTATFDGPTADTEVIYEVGPTGVKETIEITERPTTPASFAYALKLSAGLSPSVGSGGDVEVRSSAGEVIYGIPAPFMYDASGADAGISREITTSLVSTDQGWTLRVTPAASWLNDPARVYPVKIDPTVEFNPADADCWLNAAAPTSQFCTSESDYIKVGLDGNGKRRRGLVRFNLGSVPGDADISSGNLHLHLDPAQTLTTHADEYVARRATRSWTEAATWNTSNGSTQWTSPGGDFAAGSTPGVVLSGQTGGYRTFDVTDMTRAWKSGQEPNNGIMVKQKDENGNNAVGFYSSDSGSTNASKWPKLVVTYTVSDPATPSNLTVSPGGDGYTTSVTPTLAARLTHPSGWSLRGEFTVTSDGVPVWSGNSALVASGATASVVIPANTLEAGGDYTVEVVAHGSSSSSVPAFMNLTVEPDHSQVSDDKANASDDVPGYVDPEEINNEPTLAVQEPSPDVGPTSDVAEVKATLPSLIAADAEIGVMPASAPARVESVRARIEDPSSPTAAETTVQEEVEGVWASGSVLEEVEDWAEGLEAAAEDTSYVSYADARFVVTEWQGVTVSGDEATAVALAHRGYLTGGVWTDDEDEQFQVSLERESGAWQLADVKSIPAVDLAGETVVEEGDPSAMAEIAAAEQAEDDEGTGAAEGSWTYDGFKAAAYAKRYACNAQNCRNGAYNVFDNDCTNFVSQAIRAGGHRPFAIGMYEWLPYTTTWIASRKLTGLLTGYYENWARYRKVNMGAAYTPAHHGDVFLYDWGKGHGWSHVSVVTGWGTYIKYWDYKKQKGYWQVTGGRGDKIAQHTRDRDGAPWNWGYHTERNPKVRARMRTILVQMNASGP